jgi:hypothetical protein
LRTFLSTFFSLITCIIIIYIIKPSKRWEKFYCPLSFWLPLSYWWCDSSIYR